MSLRTAKIDQICGNLTINYPEKFHRCVQNISIDSNLW